MRDGPAAGVALLDDLVADDALRGSHRVWAIRADLHGRIGDTSAAIADYEQALLRVTNEAERRHLIAAQRRISVDSSETDTNYRQEGDDHVAR